MIVWDFDGGRYPKYIGCPDLITTLNTDMSLSLLKEFLGYFTSVGFETGMLICPAELDVQQGKLVPSLDPFRTMLRKIRYVRETLGCTLVYIDTNYTEPGGGTLLPAEMFGRLHKAFPDVQLIPEHEDSSYYLWTTPYLALENGDTGVPQSVLKDIPGAHACIEMNQAENIPPHHEALLASFRRGDVPLVNVGWESPEYLAVLELLRSV
jgi:hypothetical protein